MINILVISYSYYREIREKGRINDLVSYVLHLNAERRISWCLLTWMLDDEWSECKKNIFFNLNLNLVYLWILID